MADRRKHTQSGDAPLAQARHADATAVADAAPSTEPADTIVGRTVTIARPRAELYAFWREFKNLPRFMDNIERIDETAPNRTHWVVKAPAGKIVEWDSIITEEIPNERIAWSTTDDSSIRHSGSVEFRDAQGNRGTEVTATIVYDPPGGAIGKAIAKLFQREPKVQARQDLRRFKQLMETGEIATSQPPDAAPRA
jgi:uncharacterized membrane protein